MAFPSSSVLAFSSSTGLSQCGHIGSCGFGLLGITCSERRKLLFIVMVLSLPSSARDIPQPLYGCLLTINNWSCNVGCAMGTGGMRVHRMHLSKHRIDGRTWAILLITDAERPRRLGGVQTSGAWVGRGSRGGKP